MISGNEESLIKYYDNERIILDKLFHEKGKVLVDIVKIIGCKKCGKCCELTGSPALSYPEILHFKKKVEINIDDMSHNYRLPHPCPFFDNSKKICKTERYKPFLCKIFPFSIGDEKVNGFAIVLCKTGKIIAILYKQFLLETCRSPSIGENTSVVIYDKHKYNDDERKVYLDYIGAIPFDTNFDNIENFYLKIKKIG